MTNFEYYKEKILDFASKNDCGIALVNNKIIPCDDAECYMCQFYQTTSSCEQNLLKWLYTEHIVPPTLIKKEHQFCELIETGYIARDENGKLYWYTNKPSKREHTWYSSYQCMLITSAPLPVKFDFITWEDKEPWSVEDLLKLEVK